MIIVTILRTLLSYCLFVVLFIIFTPFWIINVVVSKDWLFKSILFWQTWSLWNRLAIEILFLPITFIGQENVSDESAIFVMNHQSGRDAWLIDRIFMSKPRVVLMKEKYVLSIFKTVSIPVDMSTPLKSTKSLLRAIKMLNDNPTLNVMIFPEGTRYSDGNIHDFFSGFVILAKKTSRPVVPIRIFGMEKAYPRGSWLIHRVPITVVVGKPLVYQEGDTDEGFKERVHMWFVQQKKD
ncbi:MAG: lysophospholipid acyltransferase family protein [Candidatus Dependentiae bacterium]|nr:lysophospholipid acyltransferase family protein [Candidatus Dependentiae bacterium]